MLNPSNLIVLAAAAGIASAAPAAIDSGAGSFSVNQVRNPHFKAHGPSALAKAYLKYGKALPKDLENAIANYTLSKRSTGSATTTPESNDLEYLTPVSIGTPAQVLNLDFDSGSSDLWVFSSELSSSSRGSHSYYTASSSSTSKKLSGATWSITYGDGSSSSGDVYTDKVTVGGLTFASQAVEAAQKVSSQFVQDTDNDGLLGLAFSSINTVKPTKQKTFFDNVKSSLDSPVWTADLKHNKAGKYNFGYIDSSAYTGSLTYTSVDSSDGFWSFTSSGYAIGSAAFKSSSFSGIADTGTTLALLPDTIVSAYYKSFGATYSSSAGGYLFPCSTTPPNFTFGVGSARIVIPGSYINYAVYSGSQCYGGIQSDDGIGFSIFGDVALKAAFVVFDSTPKLGWASKTL